MLHEGRQEQQTHLGTTLSDRGLCIPCIMKTSTGDEFCADPGDADTEHFIILSFGFGKVLER
jgi:hypothetical protein